MLLICVETPLNVYMLLQSMESMGGITNDFDCPLFIMTSTFRLVPSVCVVTEVSFVHECTSGCKFSRSTPLVTVERESVSQDRLVFEHDYSSNNMYCLNVFCMNQ